MTHSHAVKKITDENGIDSQRIYNLDESACKPSRDFRTSSHFKAYVARAMERISRAPKFKRVDRVTLMPVIFAKGTKGRSLFVIKGNAVRYCVIKMAITEVVKKIPDYLPSGSMIALRKEAAGVYTNIFFIWSETFFQDFKHLEVGGRNVLLLLDGYRRHMTYIFLARLDVGGIIIYELPPHTS